MPKPKWLEPIEQFGHYWMALGANLVCLDPLWFWREDVKQWPPGTPILIDGELYYPHSRVRDMMNDMRSCIWGCWSGNVLKTAAAIGVIVWLTTCRA